MVSRDPRYAIGVFSLCILGTVACRKFPQSVFQLAPESRLPRWFMSSRKLTRSDFTVQMAYYTSPLGRVAVFTLWDGYGNKLDEVDGQQRGYGPIESPKAGCPDGDANLRLGESRPCPLYEVITARGVTEIIEHKIFGPVFHITDDPAIRKWLRPDDVERHEHQSEPLTIH